MVDNRSAGFFGIGGSFNFKSGDISGTAAKTQDDKMGQGGEYFAQPQGEEYNEQTDDNKFMDRSAILRATLNSLAMMNVANVINSRKQALNNTEKNEIEEVRRSLERQHNEENNQRHNQQNTPQKEEDKDIENKIEQEYNDFISDFDRNQL